MHSTVGDMLCTLCRQEPPQNAATAAELVDSALASAQYGLRTAGRHTFDISPGALMFQHDMLLPIPVLADYNMIRYQRRQTVIDDNNQYENLRRCYHDYQLVTKSSYLHRTLQLYKNDQLDPISLTRSTPMELSLFSELPMSMIV
jgi:hypothetical protein